MNTTVTPRNQNPLYRYPVAGFAEQYPTQPPYCSTCDLNTRYKTLPNGWPMNVTIKNSTLKSLYSGPLYYPYQYLYYPVDTMYREQFYEADYPGQLKHYHFQAYPLTDRYVREVREYRGDMLPYPSLVAWSEKPVQQIVPPIKEK